MILVGPKPEHIRTRGDKVEAKRTAVKLGLHVVPGSPGAVTFSEETKKLAKDIGYPVLLKAASGGGGRGMKVVPGEDSIESLMSQASSERLEERLAGKEGAGTLSTRWSPYHYNNKDTKHITTQQKHT